MGDLLASDLGGERDWAPFPVALLLAQPLRQGLRAIGLRGRGGSVRDQAKKGLAVAGAPGRLDQRGSSKNRGTRLANPFVGVPALDEIFHNGKLVGKVSEASRQASRDIGKNHWPRFAVAAHLSNEYQPVAGRIDYPPQCLVFPHDGAYHNTRAT